ncbi:hypothetical protein BU24DRAFT_17174 [Aaosphaeria arxii CBS 175.79]|uniref:Uncharacterized protein n=1 Tax=Aaosphaeria arxii CBS 175.79 TaxID=1450172 RepID=A0A6A5Y8S6_9PLEO|nr:uncharacterized protein BU24DRAFT_17174 [Aaosphaeria arxii CBS 175.79]KAF2021220.1 hypothetical protein BU24DRAFT_17174 [Aaosphaeria arxii CBS 175.79]
MTCHRERHTILISPILSESTEQCQAAEAALCANDVSLCTLCYRLTTAPTTSGRPSFQPTYPDCSNRQLGFSCATLTVCDRISNCKVHRCADPPPSSFLMAAYSELHSLQL